MARVIQDWNRRGRLVAVYTEYHKLFEEFITDVGANARVHGAALVHRLRAQADAGSELVSFLKQLATALGYVHFFVSCGGSTCVHGAAPPRVASRTLWLTS